MAAYRSVSMHNACQCHNLVLYAGRLGKFKKECPGEGRRAGWSGRDLEKPTYQLPYEHSVNCYFEKEKWRFYSYTWASIEAKERAGIFIQFLSLMEVRFEELIEYIPFPT